MVMVMMIMVMMVMVMMVMTMMMVVESLERAQCTQLVESDSSLWRPRHIFYIPTPSSSAVHQFSLHSFIPLPSSSTVS